MQAEAIQERVKEIMVGLFALDAGEIGSETTLQTVEKWDSLNHVNLMMALEQEFGVQIEPEDALEMITYPAVCDGMARYLEGNA